MMVKFWLGLSQDNKVAIVTTLVTVFSILVGAGISIWQIRTAKKREIEAKSHEQRKEKYEQLLLVIQKIFANVKTIGKGKMPFTQQEWLDLQFGMAMYASSAVYQKYIEFRRIAEKSEGLEGILQLGNLILLMRKELGFSDDIVSVRDVLGTFINDIYDPKHDELFDRVS